MPSEQALQILLDESIARGQVEYAPGDDIHGHVTYNAPQKSQEVSKVTITLRGRACVDPKHAPKAIRDEISVDESFLSEERCLFTGPYKIGQQALELPFRFQLPLVRRNDGRDDPLPPSFERDFGYDEKPYAVSFHVSIRYTLFAVVEMRSRLSQNISTALPLKVRPLTLERRPSLPTNTDQTVLLTNVYSKEPSRRRALSKLIARRLSAGPPCEPLATLPTTVRPGHSGTVSVHLHPSIVEQSEVGGFDLVSCRIRLQSRAVSIFQRESIIVTDLNPVPFGESKHSDEGGSTYTINFCIPEDMCPGFKIGSLPRILLDYEIIIEAVVRGGSEDREHCFRKAVPVEVVSRHGMAHIDGY